VKILGVTPNVAFADGRALWSGHQGVRRGAEDVIAVQGAVPDRQITDRRADAPGTKAVRNVTVFNRHEPAVLVGPCDGGRVVAARLAIRARRVFAAPRVGETQWLGELLLKDLTVRVRVERSASGTCCRSTNRGQSERTCGWHSDRGVAAVA
jgi:hypothetical protein